MGPVGFLCLGAHRHIRAALLCLLGTLGIQRIVGAVTVPQCCRHNDSCVSNQHLSSQQGLAGDLLLLFFGPLSQSHVVCNGLPLLFPCLPSRFNLKQVLPTFINLLLIVLCECDINKTN